MDGLASDVYHKGVYMVIKTKLHPRNQHSEGYDFVSLVAETPDLEPFTTQNPAGQTTIDFQDAGAVRMLNRALLKAHYKIDFWEPENIFRDVIKHDDVFHITMCNPPFHASIEQATKGTHRKCRNLGKGRSKELNFGGLNAELWCPGSEIGFIARVIEQSTEFAGQCLWFSSLVSKKDHIQTLSKVLRRGSYISIGKYERRVTCS